jgi:uncharacterized protein YodC (DUF2158 family)
MAEFKAGDVVELKSGGPRMTVAAIGTPIIGHTKATVRCEWFEGANKMWGRFSRESLKLSPE